MAHLPPFSSTGTTDQGDFENPRRLYPLVTPKLNKSLVDARTDRWGRLERAEALLQPRRLVRSGYAKKETQVRDISWLLMMWGLGRQIENTPPSVDDLIKLLPLPASSVGASGGVPGQTVYHQRTVTYESDAWVGGGTGARDEQLVYEPADYLEQLVMMVRCLVTETWQSPLQLSQPTIQLEMVDRDGVQVDSDEILGTQGSRIDWTWSEEIQTVNLVVTVPGDQVRNLTQGAVEIEVIYVQVAG